MALKRPPVLVDIEPHEAEQYRKYARIGDDKGRYLPWDKFRFHVSRGDNPVKAWSVTRMARQSAAQRISYFNEKDQQAQYCLTPALQQVCELVDKFTTATALRESMAHLEKTGGALNPLVMDESITSSQLEGANTTTNVARDMLASGRRARTESEQMIVGNARLMDAIATNRNQPLSVGLIRHFHHIGTSGINDGLYTPGELRTSDNVVIADYDGNVVHQPPVAKSLEGRLQAVCDWVNNSDVYTHPLIKACVLHFMIAHEHPFNDGNGRTSRALFYWLMLKSGYDAFRFISISRLLYAAPVKYAFSYQHTESDGMDLTYFLIYQAQVIADAVRSYLGYIDNLLKQHKAMVADANAVTRKLTARQKALLAIMRTESTRAFTAAEVSVLMGVSDNTARTDLRALVRESLASQSQQNAQQTSYIANV